MLSLSIKQLNTKLKNKEITAVQLTKQFLERIKQVDTKLQAYLNLHTEDALARAKEIDAKGDFSNLLTGIPFANKALICKAGVECNAGSKILQDFKPVTNSTVIDKLEHLGAICIGNVNCDEFAQGSSTENSAYQKTKNPWDTAKVPGGSSGGSAVAVSADECVFALGTDTGGSIRQPAAFCGCVGLKPTYGRVSRSGVMAYASSFDTIGPLGKTVEDVAIILEAIAGQDNKDFTTVPNPVPIYSQNLATDLSGKKIAYIKEFFNAESLDANIKKSCLDLFDNLKTKGSIIEEISMPELDYAIAVYYLLVKAEGSTNLHRYDGIRYGKSDESAKTIEEVYELTRAKNLGSEVKRCIMLGTYILSSGYYDAYYLKAAKVRRLIKEAFDKVFTQYNAIIAPVSPFLPFGFDEKTADPLSMYLADIYTVPVNLAGIPAISLPIDIINNLPMGIQIMGQQFNEQGILQIAYEIEKMVDFKRINYNA